MTRAHLAAFAILALSACSVAAAAAAAPVSDEEAAVAYMTSVAGPAMKASCEKMSPGHAAKFDALFPAWQKRKAGAVAAGRNAVRKPGQTDAQVDAGMRAMVQKFFSEDTAESQKAGCNEMLADLRR